MLRSAVAFLTGICAVHVLPALPAAWVLAAIAMGLLLMARALRSVVVMALALGWMWAGSHASLRLADDLPAALEGVDLLVRGSVASLVERSGTDPQFEFAVDFARAGVPRKIRLSWYDATDQPRAGEAWQFVVRLKRRNGFANPGGHDYEAQLLRLGVGATGYIRSDDRNIRLSGPQARYGVLRTRAWLAQRIHDAVGDHPMLGILQGLAVGETQAMSAEQWQVLAATGTTHLMAISGLHITMVATLAAWLGGQLTRWPAAQRRRLTALHGQIVCGMLGAAGYALLAGLSIPTQRTLAMLCVVLAARALRREWGIDRTLGAAALAVLIVDPFAPLSPGAWLSFGAVAVILLAVSGRRSLDGVIGNFTRVQLAVSLGLIPILIAAFGAVSLVSPLVNAIAVPLFTLLIVPLVLLGAFIGAFWLPGGALILELTAGLLDVVWPAFEWTASLPLALWHLPALPVPLGFSLTAGVLILLLPGIAPTRAAGFLLCLPGLVWRPAPLSEGEFRLTLLDVGQGLATVVQTRSHTLVFDAGPAFRSGRDTGEMVVLPYLRSVGVRRVDMMVISHGDLDHQGGMVSVIDGLRVDRLLVGPSVVSEHPAATCVRGQRWHWDGVAFEVRHPGAARTGSDNDSSCVLRIAGSGGSALLTGDIQREGEAALLAAGVSRSDIVVAPHHGSRTSSTPELVNATTPSIVLFAAGYGNRWGFPKSDVTARWQARGARTFDTATSGAIEIEVLASGPASPREYRQASRRYWRAR